MKLKKTKLFKAFPPIAGREDSQKCQPEICIEAKVLEEIKATLGTLPPETGGILLKHPESDVISKFVYDKHARTTAIGYDPDIVFLNDVLKREYAENNLIFAGAIHSHPAQFSRLSGVIDAENAIGDMAYIQRFFEVNPELEKMYVPIVHSTHDNGSFEIFPYVAFRADPMGYQLAKLEVRQDDTDVATLNYTPDLTRLTGSVDTAFLQNIHIVAIGAGGAAGIYKNYASIGIGKLTVIDCDRVDSSNIATQEYYLEDVGMPKVDALKRHIRAINPGVNYEGIHRDFMQMNTEEYDELFSSADIVLAMTDDFQCQSLINKLAIKHNKSCVFAMMYEKAKCAEITFNIPGVTPACHRCATSSRYAAYNDGYVNDVTSTGSTIFHTDYLNAPIGLLTLAILHRDHTDVELGKWLGDRWTRNFLQIRMHPQHSMEEGCLFNMATHAFPGLFNFDAIWQEVTPDDNKSETPCPDCFGLGDLAQSSVIIRQVQDPAFLKNDWLKDPRLQ